MIQSTIDWEQEQINVTVGDGEQQQQQQTLDNPGKSIRTKRNDGYSEHFGYVILKLEGGTFEPISYREFEPIKEQWHVLQTYQLKQNGIGIQNG